MVSYVIFAMWWWPFLVRLAKNFLIWGLTSKVNVTVMPFLSRHCPWNIYIKNMKALGIKTETICNFTRLPITGHVKLWTLKSITPSILVPSFVTDSNSIYTRGTVGWACVAHLSFCYEEAYHRTFHSCFPPSFGSFGKAVSEKKIFLQSTNQKQESVVAMFVNGSEIWWSMQFILVSQLLVL
jgi:hypothetical protein